MEPIWKIEAEPLRNAPFMLHAYGFNSDMTVERLMCHVPRVCSSLEHWSMVHVKEGYNPPGIPTLALTESPVYGHPERSPPGQSNVNHAFRIMNPPATGIERVGVKEVCF